MIIKNTLKNLIFIFVMYIVCSNPYMIMESVKNGLGICYESIIPSLFVFTVISNYARQSDILSLLSLPFYPYSKLMKVKDKSYSGYLLLSLIGGFAIGANMLKKLQDDGYDEKALDVLGITMINNSFGFCVFTLGAGMLNNYFTGLLLYGALCLSSLITAFLVSFLYPYNIVTSREITEKSTVSLVESIRKSTDTILYICGFVVVFNCMCEVIQLYTGQYSDFICIFMEITCGLLGILSNYGNNLYLICFALSVLPVCTLCQVYYFTGNKSLVKTLMASRIIHTPLSLIVFSLLKNMFPVSVQTASAGNMILKGYSAGAELSFTLFILTFIFLKLFENNKLFTKKAE